MKIIVKSEKFRLRLWFPLGMLKSKMLRRGFSKKIVDRNGGNQKSSKHECDEEKLTAEQGIVAQEEVSQQEDGLGLSIEVKKLNETETEAALQNLDDAGSQVVHDDVVDKKVIDEQLKGQFEKAYAILKQYVKQNGHFTLMEVDSADKETYVKIII